MKNKSKIKNLSILFMIMVVMTFAMLPGAKASTKQVKSLEEFIQEETSIDLNQAKTSDVIQAYEELSEKYTNQELADIVEQHQGELVKQGVDEKFISNGTTVLRSMDSEQLKDILKNDLNIEEIQKKLQNGQSLNSVLYHAVDEMTAMEKLNLLGKFLYASSIFRTAMIVIIILFAIGTILRWIIYRKAGKHGWAAIVPLYRQVTMLKLCGLGPWWLLLLVIPILGWAILLILEIVLKFKLAKVFGRGFFFGLGLLILSIIFEAVIAFNPNIEYVGPEE